MPAHRLCPICNQPALGRHNACHARLYNQTHRLERRYWQPIVNTGRQPCARDPNHLIDPEQPWHLDHLDDGTTAPSCALHNLQATRGIG